MSVVNDRALPVAKAIMAIPGVDQLTKATCAEMILGMDVRIFFEPKRKDDKPQPGEYSLNVDVQQPLGGRALGLHRDKELEGKANSAYKYDFAGTVQFSDATTFSPMETISWTPDSKFGGQWNVYSYKKELSGPTQPGVQKMSAKIKWRVNDLDVEYDRPIAVGGFEVGCAEKALPVTNCNHLWVPGILIRDHGNWGCSFHLPDGTYISAASQGNQIEVYDETDKKKEKTWVSPNDSCLTQGSRCLFRVSTDWHGLECRVRELKLLGSATEEVHGLQAESLHRRPCGHRQAAGPGRHHHRGTGRLPHGRRSPGAGTLPEKPLPPCAPWTSRLKRGTTASSLKPTRAASGFPSTGVPWEPLPPASAMRRKPCTPMSQRCCACSSSPATALSSA